MVTVIEIRPGRNINITMHILDQNAPTLFMIHGGGGRGKQWRKQIPEFKEQYNLIIPDLLGHGLSDKPKPHKNNPYSFTEFSEDLQIIFDKYKTHENVIIGHSYGGALAAYLAAKNQNEIEKLILIAPANPKPQIKIPLLYRLPAPILELIRPILENKFRRMAYTNTASQNLIEEENTESKVNHFYVLKALLDGRIKTPEIVMKKIKISTLILEGEKDQITPNKMITETYADIPNHQFITLANASHMLMLEQSDEVNELIRMFLKHAQ